VCLPPSVSDARVSLPQGRALARPGPRARGGGGGAVRSGAARRRRRGAPRGGSRRGRGAATAAGRRRRGEALLFRRAERRARARRGGGARRLRPSGLDADGAKLMASRSSPFRAVAVAGDVAIAVAALYAAFFLRTHVEIPGTESLL